ncbi:MAG: hypothetical protein SWX82_14670 [Cyanobacteriota bacterium]|nr:hypothetical protein [Cyanobacteriota bacterium]
MSGIDIGIPLINSKPVTFCWVLLPLNPTYICKVLAIAPSISSRSLNI